MREFHESLFLLQYPFVFFFFFSKYFSRKSGFELYFDIHSACYYTRSILATFLEGSMRLLLIPGKRDSAKHIAVISRDTSVVNVSFNIGIVSRLLLVLREDCRYYQSHTYKDSLIFFQKTEPTQPGDGFVRCVRRQRGKFYISVIPRTLIQH